MSEKSNQIQIGVRIRSLIPREKEQKSEELWCKNGEKSICRTDFSDQYTFDRVYGNTETTEVIFEELVQPILLDFIQGINGTLLAYGQTSSGKTHTMMGNEQCPGLILLCINNLFKTIENVEEKEYFVKVSYMEIYNEVLVDLLGDVKKSLVLSENYYGEVCAKDLNECLVQNKDECLELLRKGEKARHYSSTAMNERSSRSHVIFRLTLESRCAIDPNKSSFFVSQLNLVDLAGSERQRHTGNTGQRLTEGTFINRSLLTLSQVTTQLATNNTYVSYRDSKLTRLLQNSLGGNSKTAFILAVTPAALDETIMTLRFSKNLKKIQNRPVVNETIPDKIQMGRMLKEIEALKKQLKDKNKDEDYKKKYEIFDKYLAVFRRDQDSEQRTKRRETWCPQKAQQHTAMNPLTNRKDFHTFKLIPHKKSLSDKLDEEDDANNNNNAETDMPYNDHNNRYSSNQELSPNPFSTPVSDKEACDNVIHQTDELEANKLILKDCSKVILKLSGCSVPETHWDQRYKETIKLIYKNHSFQQNEKKCNEDDDEEVFNEKEDANGDSNNCACSSGINIKGGNNGNKLDKDDDEAYTRLCVGGMDGLVDEVKEVRGENERLVEELRIAREENESLNGEIVKIIDNNEKLNQEVSQFKEHNEKLNEEFLQLRNGNDNLNEEMKIYKEDNDKLNEEVKKFKVDKDELNKELLQYKEDIEKLNDEIIKYKDNIEKLNEDMIKNKNDYDKFNREITKYQNDNEILNQEITKYRDDIKTSNEEILKYKNDNEKLNGEFKSIENEMERLKKELKLTSESNERLEKEFTLFKDNTDRLHEELAISRDDNDKLTESLKSATNELVESKERVSIDEELVKENELLKLKIEEIKKNLNEVKKLNPGLVEEVVELKNEKDDVLKANDILNAQQCELMEEKEFFFVEKALSDKSNKDQDSEDNLETKAEIVKLQSKVEEILAEKDFLSSEKGNLMLEKEKIMKKKDEFEAENSELMNKNEVLKIENARLEAELQEAKENIDRSDGEIERFSIMTNDFITEIEDLTSDLESQHENKSLLSGLKKAFLMICRKLDVESDTIAKEFEKLELDEKMIQKKIESLRFLEDDLKIMVEERNFLLMRYNLLEQEASNVKGEVSNLREVNAALVHEVKDMRIKTNELESFSKSRDLLQEEILAMKHEFKNVKEKLEDEQVALQEKCEQCEKLKVNLHDLEAEKRSVEIELANLKEVLNEKDAKLSEVLISKTRDVYSAGLKNELEESKQQVALLQESLEEYEKKFLKVKNECNDRIKVLEEEFRTNMDKKVKELEKLRNDEKEKLLETVEECFEKERNEIYMEKESVEKRLTEERSKIEELMVLNKQLIYDAEVKEKRIDDLNKEFDEEKNKIKKDCKHLENEIDLLKNENNELNSEITKLKDSYNIEIEKIQLDYRTENQRQSADIDRLQLAVKDAEIVIKKLNDEKEIFEEKQKENVKMISLELKEEKTKNENLKNDIDNLENIVKNLTQKLEEEKIKMESMSELQHGFEMTKKTLEEVREQKELIRSDKIKLESDKINLANDISALKKWRERLNGYIESISGCCISDLTIDELKNHINRHIQQQLSSQLSLIQDEVTTKNDTISALMAKNNEEYKKNTKLKEEINDLNSKIKALNEQLLATQFEVTELKLKTKMLEKRGADNNEMNSLKQTVESQAADLARIRESRSMVTAEFLRYKEKAETQEMDIRQFKRQIKEQEEALKRLTTSTSMERIKSLEAEVEKMRLKMQANHAELDRARENTMQLKTKIMDRDKKLLEQTEEIFGLQDKLLSKEPFYPPLPAAPSESAFYQVLGDDRRRLMEENHMMKKELNDIRIRMNKRDKQLTNIKIELLNKEKQIHAYEKRHTPQASHASKTPLGENNNNIPHTSSRIPCSNDQEKEDTVVLLKSLNKK